MTSDQIHISFLRLIKGIPYVSWKNAAFFIQETHGRSNKQAETAALNRLIEEKVITNYDYIEEAETPVVVVETRFTIPVVCAPKCNNQVRCASPARKTRTRASVFCLEST